MPAAGRALACDSGSAAAEFALVMPAVALLLALVLGALQLGTAQVRLTDAAADAARLLGRGEPESLALERIVMAEPGARLAVDHRGALVCATVTADASMVGLGAVFSFEGRGCALDDTRAEPGPEGEVRS